MHSRSHIEGIIDKIVKSTPPTVVFGVGVPASGKSTTLQAVGNELGIQAVDVDGILSNVKSDGWDEHSYSRFQNLVREDALRKVHLGSVALIDSTYCHFEERRRESAFYRSAGIRTIGAVVMDISIEGAVYRDSQRNVSSQQGRDTIARMHAALKSDIPGQGDGLDWAIQIPHSI